jgi:hypothetical protein
MKRFLVIAALLALSASAAYAVPPAGKGKPQSSTSSTSSTPSSAELCKTQRGSMGMSAFRALYAPNGSPKAAMDACLAKVQVQVTQTFKNAAKECKDERAKGADAFATKYGTNANKRNAFGKCVSQKAKEATEEEQDETVGAAKQCKKDKAADAQAFAGKYGNKNNAFGKCVSQTSKETDNSDD